LTSSLGPPVSDSNVKFGADVGLPGLVLAKKILGAESKKLGRY